MGAEKHPHLTICDVNDRHDLLPQITDLHARRIPSFRTSLGKEHLLFLYQVILENNLGNIFAAIEKDRLVGFFCTVDELTQLNRIAKGHMKWGPCLRSVIRNPVFLLDIAAHLLFLRSVDSSRLLYLASIATDLASQGSDAGASLLRKAMEISRTKQKPLTALVWKNNWRALSFYKKNDFVIAKSLLNIYQITWDGHRSFQSS